MINQARPLTRRTVLGVGVAAWAAAGLAGCRTGPADPAVRDKLLADWGEAVRAGDPSAEASLWSGEVAPAAARASLATFEAVADPTGPDSVVVTWQLPDDQTQTHRLRVAAEQQAGRHVLVRLDSPGEAAPMWWLQPSSTVLGERCGILAAIADADPGATWGGRPVQTWLDLADRAVATAITRTGRDRVRVWLQLVTVPEQLGELGVNLAASTAGAAWLMGQSSVHVVLDPINAGALNDAEAAALLRHEVVHVLTEAPRTDLPLWVEEGYAEAVTWADDEQAGWWQASDLVARIRSDGSRGLTVPTDADFTGAVARDAYARAWTLCRWLELRGGDGGGWAALRTWYDRQALTTDEPPAEEAEALAEVFGLTVAQRLQGWQDWLVEKAS